MNASLGGCARQGVSVLWLGFTMLSGTPARHNLGTTIGRLQVFSKLCKALGGWNAKLVEHTPIGGWVARGDDF